MNKYFIGQTSSHKTYIILPDDWSGVLRNILSWTINIGSVFTRTPNDHSLTRLVLGPRRMFLHIAVRPLLPEEEEPSIEATCEYFDGLAYRQNFFDESTGEIEVLSKKHFTAKYYRMNSASVQFIKKYCLYIQRIEYLITAILANVPKNEQRPDEAEMEEKEGVYDKVVQSLFLEEK